MFPAMATDSSGEPLPANPCCKLWKKEWDILCKGMRVLCPKLDKAEAESLRLKKEYEEERARAVAEREAIKKELDIKENEVSDLKSEMFSLQQRYEQDLRDREEEAKLFQDQVSEGKNEINRLKELLEKEKVLPDNEEGKRGKATKETKKLKTEKANDEKTKLLKCRVSEAKKEIRQLRKLLDQEKRRAECESRTAESEKKKAEDYLGQIDALSQQANETKSELILLTAKLEKVSKQLEAEKQKRLKHKKHEDSQIATGKEQKKLGKQSSKKAESLSQKYAAARQEIEELQKQIGNQKVISLEMHAGDMVNAEEQRRLAEEHKKMAIEEKSRADDLARQLRQARSKIKDLQKQVDELQSSGKPVEASPGMPYKEKDAGKSEIRILKKELKFERMRVKHAKQAAEMEKVRKDVLEEEMGRLKLEFRHFSNRLNLLDGCFSTDREGTDDVVKTFALHGGLFVKWHDE